MTIDYIITSSGIKFHFLEPRPEEVKILDIAHHLSNICRFTGATREFYSVAQHCLLVSYYLPEPLKLSGLMHDAAEAYINDVSRPVKVTHKLQETEAIIADVIDRKYSVDSRHPEVVKIDKQLFMNEVRELIPHSTEWDSTEWGIDEEELPNLNIIPWVPKVAEAVFQKTFKELGGKEIE